MTVDWTPDRSLWLALIVADCGYPLDDPRTRRITETVWVSPGEGRQFIGRRLPAAAAATPSARIRGALVPAVTESKLIGGRIQQSIHPAWEQAERAYVNVSGTLVWA